jgi:hypothetical protein
MSQSPSKLSYRNVLMLNMQAALTLITDWVIDSDRIRIAAFNYYINKISIN